MTHIRDIFLVLAAALFLASCAPEGAEDAAPSGALGISVYEGPDTDLDLVTGQTVFVPAYSEILLGGGRTLSLSPSIAIHNADLSESLVVQSVRQYDTHGNLVNEYVEKPLQLAPMATKVLVMEQPGKGTGAGANFVVEWAAQKAIYEPVIEAVMVGSSGNQGFSLISPGRVIKQYE